MTKQKNKRCVSFLVVCVILAIPSCVSIPTPEGKPLAALTFAHIEPLSVDVFTRDIQNNAKIINRPPSFTHPVSDMVVVYLQQKIKPSGDTGVVIASLDELSITKDDTHGINKTSESLKIGRYDLYTVSMKLRLEHHNDTGDLIHGTVINASRKMNISEHASIAKREQKQMEGLEQMFLSLDKHIQKVIKQDMKL